MCRAPSLSSGVFLPFHCWVGSTHRACWVCNTRQACWVPYTMGGMLGTVHHGRHAGYVTPGYQAGYVTPGYQAGYVPPVPPWGMYHPIPPWVYHSLPPTLCVHAATQWSEQCPVREPWAQEGETAWVGRPELLKSVKSVNVAGSSPRRVTPLFLGEKQQRSDSDRVTLWDIPYERPLCARRSYSLGCLRFI